MPIKRPNSARCCEIIPVFYLLCLSTFQSTAPEVSVEGPSTARAAPRDHGPLFGRADAVRRTVEQNTV
jgi:hypothetical protein